MIDANGASDGHLLWLVLIVGPLLSVGGAAVALLLRARLRRRALRMHRRLPRGLRPTPQPKAGSERMPGPLKPRDADADATTLAA